VTDGQDLGEVVSLQQHVVAVLDDLLELDQIQ
jgi:hypothetical protein